MPVPRFDLIADRRALIDRRALADALAALPGDGLLPAATALLGDALAAGRAEVARRLEDDAEPRAERGGGDRLPPRPDCFGWP